MDRLQRSQPGTLTANWERDGAPVDPGVGVTVTITRDDGTVLINAQNAAAGDSTDERTFVLTPAQTATLDRLTAVWTATDGSTLTTYAEIAGGFLFTVARARQRSPLNDASAYTTENILFYRALAEIALEDVCGVAFVPRYSREIATVTGPGMLSLPRRRITSVKRITTASDSGQIPLASLAGLRIEHGSSIFMPALWSAWSWWAQPIEVSYEHGMQEPPPRVGRACLELARRWLVESPWDERMTGYRDRTGGELQILTASHSDPFDLPEVVAIAEQYGTPLVA